MRIAIHAGFARSLIDFRGELVQALCDAGADVHAIAPGLDSDDSTRKKLAEKGVTAHDLNVERTGLNPIRDITSIYKLYRCFRKVKPDILLSYTIKPVIYGLLAAWMAGVPNRYALITGLGYAFTGEARGKRWVIQRLARLLYKTALRHATVVFFQNPDDEALFFKLGILGRSARTMVVNGSGIDINRYPLTDLPAGAPKFLLIARLLGDKGVREYVAAAARIRERYPDVCVRLVGGIDSNPDAISQAELDSWIDAGHIEYLGKLKDVRPAIADSSVYVLPSYREGTPRTVLEAMAMGRAIITTDAPGCRETVKPNTNGFLVPVKSVDALASAMEQFIREPLLVAKFGVVSRRIAEEKYDVRKVNEMMLRAMNI